MAGELQDQYDEREEALKKSLEASEKFWPGLDELKHILKDVQDTLDSEELPAAELEPLKEQKSEHEVSHLFYLRLLKLYWNTYNTRPDCLKRQELIQD